MPKVIPSAYRHDQPTASLQWTISHNLSGAGAQVPIVDVYTDVGGFTQKIIPSSIEIVDENTVVVEFSVARSGFAVVLV